jgi:hypothetical protein
MTALETFWSAIITLVFTNTIQTWRHSRLNSKSNDLGPSPVGSTLDVALKTLSKCSLISSMFWPTQPPIALVLQEWAPTLLVSTLASSCAAHCCKTKHFEFFLYLGSVSKCL